jgi:hypothetical protein
VSVEGPAFVSLDPEHRTATVQALARLLTRRRATTAPGASAVPWTASPRQRDQGAKRPQTWRLGGVSRVTP